MGQTQCLVATEKSSREQLTFFSQFVEMLFSSDSFDSFAIVKKEQEKFPEKCLKRVKKLETERNELEEMNRELVEQEEIRRREYMERMSKLEKQLVEETEENGRLREQLVEKTVATWKEREVQDTEHDRWIQSFLKTQTDALDRYTESVENQIKRLAVELGAKEKELTERSQENKELKEEVAYLKALLAEKDSSREDIEDDKENVPFCDVRVSRQGLEERKQGHSQPKVSFENVNMIGRRTGKDGKKRPTLPEFHFYKLDKLLLDEILMRCQEFRVKTDDSVKNWTVPGGEQTMKHFLDCVKTTANEHGDSFLMIQNGTGWNILENEDDEETEVFR